MYCIVGLHTYYVSVLLSYPVHAAIASDCLNQSDLKQVYKAVFDARAKWRRIGLELELAHGDLEAIDSRYRNPEDQLEQVLAKWLNRGEATWRQLSEALYSVPVGETALAKQIRVDHCQQGWLINQYVQSGVHEGGVSSYSIQPIQTRYCLCTRMSHTSCYTVWVDMTIYG